MCGVLLELVWNIYRAAFHCVFCAITQIQLMSHFKMSTARDFRINVACLEEALQDNDDQEDLPGEETVDEVLDPFFS